MEKLEKNRKLQPKLGEKIESLTPPTTPRASRKQVNDSLHEVIRTHLFQTKSAPLDHWDIPADQEELYARYGGTHGFLSAISFL